MTVGVDNFYKLIDVCVLIGHLAFFMFYLC